MTARILVPLDGSALAEQALSCAVTLSRSLLADLVLFRAVSVSSDTQELLDKAGLDSDVLMRHLETEADEYLQATAHLLLQKTGARADHIVQRGLAADAIVDYVDEKDFHLIVMASHGYSGLELWTHGSVAERVMQAASVPVLLVRAQATAPHDLKPKPCRGILVPLDGSALAEQALPQATTVARALGCEMTLFHVSVAFLFEFASQAADRMAVAYLNKVANRLREQDIRVSVAIGTGLVAESILSYANTHSVDLIALCTHGRTGLVRWTLGSVADRVFRAGTIPILMVRAKKTRHK